MLYVGKTSWYFGLFTNINLREMHYLNAIRCAVGDFPVSSMLRNFPLYCWVAMTDAAELMLCEVNSKKSGKCVTHAHKEELKNIGWGDLNQRIPDQVN